MVLSDRSRLDSCLAYPGIGSRSITFWPCLHFSTLISLHPPFFFLPFYQNCSNTSFVLQEKEVTITMPNGETMVATVRIWNETVSNLTLMALGSSAPEILLSVIEVSYHLMSISMFIIMHFHETLIKHVMDNCHCVNGNNLHLSYPKMYLHQTAKHFVVCNLKCQQNKRAFFYTTLKSCFTELLHVLIHLIN